MSADDRYLTRKQAAEFIQEKTGIPVSLNRLEKAACLGGGPRPAAQFGKRLLYRQEDVIAWAQSLIRPVEAA